MKWLQEEIEKVKSIHQLMRDLNEKNSKRMNNNIIGPFGKDEINDNGQLLSEKCVQNERRMANEY